MSIQVYIIYNSIYNLGMQISLTQIAIDRILVMRFLGLMDREGAFIWTVAVSGTT